MAPDEYLTNRVDKDFMWYDKQARVYRICYITSRVLVIIISSLITVLTGIEFKNKNLVIALLSTSIIIITGITELMKFKEQWFEYRSTAEVIKSEKIYFLTNTEPYGGADGFNVFVKNYELIVKSENKNWRNFVSSK